MQLKGAAILVVDDEPALQKIFADWVQREGATVYAASNGAEALEVAQAHHIDLVLSDVRMPVMDGVTLAKRLKDVEQYAFDAMRRLRRREQIGRAHALVVYGQRAAGFD